MIRGNKRSEGKEREAGGGSIDQRENKGKWQRTLRREVKEKREQKGII